MASRSSRARRLGRSTRTSRSCWVATGRCCRRRAPWRNEGVPILAVNLGSLGFLTEIPLNELYVALEAVDQGQCPVELRSVLDCRLVRNGKRISQNFALNDVVVNKSAISRLVEFDLYIDGNFVFQYKADGVIIATPTGSTAYSLAAGGPVLMPSVEAFAVTPVCPHSLTHRPLVVTETSQIELRIETGEEQAFLSIDGQIGLPVQQGDRVLCQRAGHKVKIMRIRRTFFEVLRNKLKWGQISLGLSSLRREFASIPAGRREAMCANSGGRAPRSGQRKPGI